MRKPLPTECRDTVTGNAFHHGCVDELTWFLEARSGWLAGLAMALCMLHVRIMKIFKFHRIQRTKIQYSLEFYNLAKKLTWTINLEYHLI